MVHWARVLENGLKLAETTGANVAVVQLFAIFHDSRRENDGSDPDHGRRGAAPRRRVARAGLRAAPTPSSSSCTVHVNGIPTGRTDPDVTVRTCWDSDRLDLGRVGIVPSPKYLCTPSAKSPKIIDWAYTRSIKGYEPDFVMADWGVPPRDW